MQGVRSTAGVSRSQYPSPSGPTSDCAKSRCRSVTLPSTLWSLTLDSGSTSACTVARCRAVRRQWPLWLLSLVTLPCILQSSTSGAGSLLASLSTCAGPAFRCCVVTFPCTDPRIQVQPVLAGRGCMLTVVTDFQPLVHQCLHTGTQPRSLLTFPLRHAALTPPTLLGPAPSRQNPSTPNCSTDAVFWPQILLAALQPADTDL